jgi:hypothetical protein
MPDVTPKPRPGPITDDDVKMLDAALEKAHGVQSTAARILCRSEEWVRRVIKITPALQARWSPHTPNQEVKTAADIADRPDLPKPLMPAEKMALALVGQEKKLRGSLSKLGFSEKHQQSILNIEEFAGQHFRETLSIVHGGLVKGFLRLTFMAEHIEEVYLQDDGLDDSQKKFWWNNYFRILENLRAMNDQVNKAALTQAMIDIKEKQAKGGMKPGFTSLTQINVGERTVTVTPVTPPNVTTSEPTV